MDTFISKDGTHIAYQQTGSGPALILVHGTSADHTSWEHTLPIFNHHFTVYAMDRRGRGGSQPEGDYAIQREFEDIAGLVAVAHQNDPNQRINLLGHSFGGLCCLEAAHMTEYIDTLLIYEPPPMGKPEALPPGLLSKMQQLYDQGDPEGLLTTFFRELVGLSADGLDELKSKPSWPDRVASAHTILREIKETITLPHFDSKRYQDLNIRTLLLVGEESPRGRLAINQEIHAALPNSKIVELPGEGHMAIHFDPKLFANQIVTLMQGSTT